MLGLVMALALAVSWPGAASAAAGWTRDPIPLPTGVAEARPHGVSCQAASNCIAVGAAFHAFAWHWNGSAWALTARPALPAGARLTGLFGVSCPSALQCIAVGGKTIGFTPLLPLAERWDGAKWHVQPTPIPAGTFAVALDAVSCDSPNSCTAVGTANAESTLAEHWNGTAWTIQPTPTPPHQNELTFTGVSCPSQTHCVAVGSTDSGPFAESWNGTSWKLLPVPLPAGATSGDLNGISCAGNATCTAVGSFIHGTQIARPRPLAEQFAGGTWTPRALPLPATGTSGRLRGVSCTTASRCTATGSFKRAVITPQALAEVWNGTAWALQPTARPISHKDLFAVSCTAAQTCSTVGADTTERATQRIDLPLAEHE
jgi:hypothetical protein